MLIPFLYGVIFTATLIVSIIFFGLWRKTKDQFFLLFALAFGLFGVERLVLTFMASNNEFKVYLIRLSAFILIIGAILLKNRTQMR